MSQTSKKGILILSSIIIASFLMAMGIQISTHQNSKAKEHEVMSVGLKPSQQEYFLKELSSTSRNIDLVHVGDALMRQGRLDEAIQHFNNLINDKSFGDKWMAKNSLIDAYEKKRDYAMAHQVLYKQQRDPRFVLPVTDEVRVPYEERIKYLKYASEGEYDLALEHAQLALDVESKKTPHNLAPFYQQRLNDLIAAKDYILSLKKK